VNKALKTDKVREALAKLGVDPGGGTPEAFGALVRSETEHWTKVVQACSCGRTLSSRGGASCSRCSMPGPRAARKYRSIRRAALVASRRRSLSSGMGDIGDPSTAPWPGDHHDRPAVVPDFGGTLVTDQKLLAERTKAAVAALHRRGNHL